MSTITQPKAPAPTQPVKSGGGMAITAFVLGIGALGLFWVPILNNVVFVLAPIALILGFVAWRKARKGKSSHGGMAVASIWVSASAMVLALAVQALFASVINDIDQSINESASVVQTVEPPVPIL